MSATGQPSLQHLLTLFLCDAGRSSAEPVSEVEPYQASAQSWVEPQAAWPDALAAAGYLLPVAAANAFRADRVAMPTGWARLLREGEPMHAIPFCVGNAPQMLRDADRLLTPGAAPWQADGRRGEVVREDEPLRPAANPVDLLVDAAQLRLQGRYDRAAALLDTIEEPEGFGALLANERAALDWHRGERAQAAQQWQALAAFGSPAIVFNRGLAALVGGDRNEAESLFQAAAAALPETSAWHHLALLYAALAEQA